MPSAFTVSGPPGANGATGATGPGFLTDTQANRPAAAIAGEGAVFIPSDGYYPARSTGAAWVVQNPLGFACTNPPATGDFTGVNTGESCTFDADGDGLSVLCMGTASASTNNIAYVKALPAAPYTLICGMEIPYFRNANYVAMGIVLSNGTDPAMSKFLPFCLSAGSGAPSAAAQKYSAINTWVANYVASETCFAFYRGPILFKIYDDNTTRYYYISTDGRVWHLIHSVARTDYATPTHGGLWIAHTTINAAATSTLIHAKIFHWSLA